MIDILRNVAEVADYEVCHVTYQLKICLKSFQNKKGQKNLVCLTKKTSFSLKKDCFFVGYLIFFGP